jgi:hypothetical protein
MDTVWILLGIHLVGAFISYGVIFADFINDWDGQYRKDRAFAFTLSLVGGWFALLVHLFSAPRFNGKRFSGFRLW